MAFTLLGVVFLTWITITQCFRFDGQVPMSDRLDEDVKVPVVLGVMSACPDALLCESVFDRVLKRVGNKIDLSLTFIGQ